MSTRDTRGAQAPQAEIIEEHCFLWLQAPEPLKQSVPTHDHIQEGNYWGCLNLMIEGLDPLFVGSGAVDLDDQGQMYQCFAQRDGQVVLPGSSFKGALRAIVEALSPSCIVVIEGKTANQNYTKICQVRREQTTIALCPACGLFGAAGYRGRLSFSEGRALQGILKIVEIPQRTPPRYCGRNGKADPCDSTFTWRKFYTRESECKAPPKKERLQVLSEARFTLEVGFQNLREWELGLLVLSLGIVPGHEFNWKLGGAKNRRMGLIQVTLDTSQPSIYAQGKDWFFRRTRNVSRDFLNQVTQAYLKQLEGWPVLSQQVEYNLQELKKEYGYGRAGSTGS